MLNLLNTPALTPEPLRTFTSPVELAFPYHANSKRSVVHLPSTIASEPKLPQTDQRLPSLGAEVQRILYPAVAPIYPLGPV